MALYGGASSLVEIRGSIKDKKPNLSGDACDRIANRIIRAVCLKRTWSDLTKFVAYPLTNETAAGTVSTTTGSDIITGNGTAWPVNDAINTVGPTAIRQPGMQRVTPASMTGIKPGTWLLLDTANSTLTEAVVVTFVVPGSFYAVVRNTHDPGFTITKSSLAGQQFRTTYPFFTVTAVLSATELLIDLPWADITQTGASYQIFQVYIQPDPYCWRVKQAWDPIQGIPIDVDNFTFEQVINGDSQLTASDDPTIMCPVPPGGGGVAQWFVYPPQVSARQILMVISTTWPRLIADQDQAPSFINPDVFVLGAIAEALRTRTVTQNMPRDPYYDPQVAMTYEAQFKEQLEDSEQADEARLATRLQAYDKMAAGFLSANFILSHPGWPTDYAR
jgi:hypothetical protein